MHSLYKKQDGQTLMEYIIITTLVGILCLVVVRDYGKTLKTKMERMKSKLGRTITIRE